MTPEELEKKAQQEKQARKKALAKIALQATLTAGTVAVVDPKLLGLEKLNQIALSKAEAVKGVALNQIQSFAEQLGIPNIESTNPTLPDVCPPQEVLDRVLQARDNLVDRIEVVAKFADITSVALNVVSSVINGTIDTLAGINVLKLAASAASKAINPLPGAIASTIADLDDLRTITTFKNDGNPRLPELKRAVSSGSTILSQISIVLNGILLVLRNIDLVLEKCGKQPKQPGEAINKLIGTAKIAQATNTGTLYKGFSFEIVEKPFTPTLNQKIGQAKNKQGIVLLQTEPSFTNNPQQLIEELKFIIDRDNLKAD